MGAGNFTDDFWQDAVVPINQRDHPAGDLSERPTVRRHLFWRGFMTAPAAGTRNAAQDRRLKWALAWVREKRDIRKIDCTRLAPRAAGYAPDASVMVT